MPFTLDDLIGRQFNVQTVNGKVVKMTPLYGTRIKVAGKVIEGTARDITATKGQKMVAHQKPSCDRE